MFSFSSYRDSSLYIYMFHLTGGEGHSLCINIRQLVAGSIRTISLGARNTRLFNFSTRATWGPFIEIPD